jgi:hypothetical protein
MRPLDPTNSASPSRCAFYATREDERAIEEIAKLRYPNRPFVTKSAIVREALQFTVKALAEAAKALSTSGVIG